MTKYKAKKTKIDNIVFSSKKEASRYLDLKWLEQSGEIKNLVLQPKFELQPKFVKNGKTYRNIVYIADFMYTNTKTGKEIIEDTKGYKTDVYQLKKKLFEFIYIDKELKEII